MTFEGKQLKAYLGGGKTGKIIGIGILVLALVLAAAGGVMLAGGGKGEAAEFFPGEDSLAGKNVWVDVVGVSDWIYDVKGTVFYAIVDNLGYGYIVTLSDEQFASLSTQNNWFNYGEAADAPDPVRMVGVSRSLSSDTVDAFAEVFDSSTDEIEQMFGTHYVDLTTTAGHSNGMVLLLVALVAAIFGIAVCVAAGSRGREADETLWQLQMTNRLQDAAMQFVSPQTEILPGDQVRIGADYLFCKTGAVLNFADILWCFGRTSTNRGVMRQEFICCTATRPNISVLVQNGNDTLPLARLAEVVQQRCPGVLVGYNAENAKAYQERVNAAAN